MILSIAVWHLATAFLHLEDKIGLGSCLLEENGQHWKESVFLFQYLYDF